MRPTSRIEPGSTEQADGWELETNECSLSRTYSGAAFHGSAFSTVVGIQNVMRNERYLQEKYTCDAFEMTDVI